MKNNQHKHQRRARTPVLFQGDKHFIVLYLKCNDLCNYSNITLYCKGLECHTLKSVVKTIGGRGKKKGPPLTLHTPGSKAFVLRRIILFDSEDKEKPQFFKAINKKMFPSKHKNQRDRAALHHSYSPLPNFGAKHKLILTASLSQQQLRGKEDAIALVKIRTSASRVFSHYTASICLPKALTKLQI